MRQPERSVEEKTANFEKTNEMSGLIQKPILDVHGFKEAGSTIRIPRRRFLGTSPEVEKAVREIVEENLTEYFTIEYNIIRK